MKKLCVNETCIGCGLCVATDPEHFDFDDNGLSNVIKNDNLDTDNLKAAIAGCPVGAIKLEGCDCGEECHCGDDCNCGDDCACHKE